MGGGGARRFLIGSFLVLTCLAAYSRASDPGQVQAVGHYCTLQEQIKNEPTVMNYCTKNQIEDYSFLNISFTMSCGLTILDLRTT